MLYITDITYPLIFKSVETLCSSRKYSYPSSPTEGNGNSEGGSKRRQFPRGWGVAHRGFFPRGLMKIGKLLINNSFSVEQAFSYRSSKQVLLFALIIFYLRPAKCFFARLTIVFIKTIVIGSWINFWLFSCCVMT